MPAAEYQSMVQRSPSSNDVLADSPKAFLRLAHIELALPLGWVVSLRMRPSQPAHRLKQGFAATLDASSPLIGGIEAAQLRWTRHAAEGFLHGVERADILNRCALRQAAAVHPAAHLCDAAPLRREHPMQTASECHAPRV